jgi:hypothetical protein
LSDFPGGEARIAGEERGEKEERGKRKKGRHSLVLVCPSHRDVKSAEEERGKDCDSFFFLPCWRSYDGLPPSELMSWPLIVVVLPMIGWTKLPHCAATEAVIDVANHHAMNNWKPYDN